MQKFLETKLNLESLNFHPEMGISPQLSKAAQRQL